MPSRLIAYGVLLAALALAGVVGWVTVSGWRADSQRLRVVDREYLAYRTTGEAYAKGDQAARKEIADARSDTDAVRRDVPVQPVRLCKSAGSVPAAVPGAAGVDGAGSGAGQLPQAAREDRDIGPDLYRLADDADDLRNALASCQADLRRGAKAD